MTRYRIALAAACLLALSGGRAWAQRPQANVRVVVKDPSGAIIPAASVQLTALEGPEGSAPATSVMSDAQGLATVTALAPGRYRLDVAFDGFEPHVTPDWRIRGGENRREVTLAIRRVDETVAVGRDPATSASDPNSDRFGNVLTREQIEALPDDPDEMERMLTEMAGPGGAIRVDGFRGGRLPPKSQIRSIRFTSGMFAAENHGGGMMFVDISTAPGTGPLRGSFDMSFRDDSLNARNAFQERKGPERNQQYTLNLSGTLRKERTSFSLSAGGAAVYDSANIYAATGAGTQAAAVRRPSDRLNFTGRIDHAINRSHTLRAMYQQNDNDQRNLGIGSFDLSERAFGRRAFERMLRLSESGPLAKAWFGEMRLQLRTTESDSFAALEQPTIRVLDAFTAGGAQQDGGRRANEVEWATNVDWARGRHAIRFGSLIEGGSFRSDLRTNYLGTYTFASLADYEAGIASTYSRRDGNPLVEYSHWQAGLFVQDDWRARKNLTLSAGLRQEIQTHLGDEWNLAPRGGLTWSPFKSGRTTVRAGGGVFYDWLEADVYEQTLRVDGERQQDLVVRSPGYPNPFDGGFADVLPTSKYVLAESLVMPKRTLANVGISQQLTSAVGLNVNLMYMTGSNRLRGRNTNAPIDGVRPDAAFGNVTAGRVDGACARHAGAHRRQRQRAVTAHHDLRQLLVRRSEERLRRCVQPARRQLPPGRRVGSRGEHSPAFRQRRRQPAAAVQLPPRRDHVGAKRDPLQHHDWPRRQRRYRVQRSARRRRSQQCHDGGVLGSCRPTELHLRLRPAFGGRTRRWPDDGDSQRRRNGERGRPARRSDGWRRREHAHPHRVVRVGAEPAQQRHGHRLFRRDDVALLRPADSGHGCQKDRRRNESRVLRRDIVNSQPPNVSNSQRKSLEETR